MKSKTQAELKALTLTIVMSTRENSIAYMYIKRGRGSGAAVAQITYRHRDDTFIALNNAS